MEILKIHASKLAKHGDIDYEAIVHDDFMKAVRKQAEAKKLESVLSYDSSFGDGK
eukprot:gene14210-20180_t